MPNTSSNKLIVKNTLLLYFRQFFTLGLSLYTSRLTLKVLGVTDFGIYAAVGGITAILSILTSSMSTSTQRFMTFELAKGLHSKFKKVYITSIQIHVLLSIVLFILGETIGLWFVYNKLTLPIDRFDIATFVYQLALLDCILSILNVPNQAMIIAHEDMGTFAMFSIVDAVLKLVSLFILFFISWDKLMAYAIFLFLILLINRIASIVYCRYKYPEIRYKNTLDISMAKEMFSLAGWNIMSNISVMGFIQGVNILLNIFFGPVLNAAYTVAMQAYSGIRSFCSSFQLASNPQIVKSYSTGDLERMHSLLITVCKMSFFLIFFLSLPFVINADAILKLWLEEVPKHTTSFFILLMLYAYLDVFAYPMDVAAQATGKVKKYNTVTSLALLSVLPFSYVCFKNNAIPETIYYIAILMSFFGLFVRLFYLSRLIDIRMMRFIKEVLIKSLLVGASSTIIPLIMYVTMSDNFVVRISIFLITYIWTGFIIYRFGLTDNEQILAKTNMFTLISKFKKK